MTAQDLKSLLDVYARLPKLKSVKSDEACQIISQLEAAILHPQLLQTILTESASLEEFKEVGRLILSLPDRLLSMDLDYEIRDELLSSQLYHRNLMMQCVDIVQSGSYDGFRDQLCHLVGRWMDLGPQLRDLFAQIVAQHLLKDDPPSDASLSKAIIDGMTTRRLGLWTLNLFNALFPSTQWAEFDCGEIDKIISVLAKSGWLKFDMHVFECILNAQPRQFGIERLVAVARWVQDSCELGSATQKLLNDWSDGRFVVLESDYDRHRFISCFVVIFTSLCPDNKQQKHTKEVQAFMKGVSNYLELENGPLRNMGLAVGEILAATLFPSLSDDKVLKFELNGRDSDVVLLRKLSTVRDAFDNSGSCILYAEPEPEVIEAEDPRPTTQPTRGEFEAYAFDDSDDELDMNDLPEKPPLKAPRNLHQALDYLKKAKKDEDPERLEVALKSLPSLLSEPRATDRLFQDVGSDLCHRLLYLMDDYNLDKFDERRDTSLHVLLSRAPKCGQQLVDAFWNGKSLGWIRRMEVLDTLLSGARLLAGKDVTHDKKANGRLIDQMATLALDESKQPQIQESTADLRVSKTRYFHPISSQIKRATPFRNAWSDQVASWVVPLCRGIWTSDLDWLRDQTRMEVQTPFLNSPLAELTSIRPEPENKVTAMTVSTAQLIARWIICIAGLIKLSGPFASQTRDCMLELGSVLGWYWDLLHRVPLRLMSEGQDEQQQHLIRLIEYPLARTSILYAFHTAFWLVRENPALCYDFSSMKTVMPFDWLDSMKNYGSRSLKEEDIVNWLIDDVWRQDTDKANRDLASDCLSMMKERLEASGQLGLEM